MKTFGKVLRTTTHWKQDMYQFLRNYRVTPHCTTGIAPAKVFFGRPMRVKLPNPVAVPSGEDHDPTTKRKRRVYLCRQRDSRDLMMLHSFKMMLNIYFMNILYANFKVIQILIYGHCSTIMNFESVRAFSS